jgi:hypothetical protein
VTRVNRTLADPEDAISLVEVLKQIQDVVDGVIEFGSPQDPNDPASTVVADGVTHNGTLVNMAGAWVEVDITAADDGTGGTRIDMVHNLGVPVTGVLPNVRWLVFGLQHDGMGKDAASTLSLSYDSGDSGSITADSFPLRLYVGGARTVSGSNPVRATVFFTVAVR